MPCNHVVSKRIFESAKQGAQSVTNAFGGLAPPGLVGGASAPPDLLAAIGGLSLIHI